MGINVHTFKHSVSGKRAEILNSQWLWPKEIADQNPTCARKKKYTRNSINRLDVDDYFFSPTFVRSIVYFFVIFHSQRMCVCALNFAVCTREQKHTYSTCPLIMHLINICTDFSDHFGWIWGYIAFCVHFILSAHTIT